MRVGLFGERGVAVLPWLPCSTNLARWTAWGAGQQKQAPGGETRQGTIRSSKGVLTAREWSEQALKTRLAICDVLFTACCYGAQVQLMQCRSNACQVEAISLPGILRLVTCFLQQTCTFNHIDLPFPVRNTTSDHSRLNGLPCGPSRPPAGVCVCQVCQSVVPSNSHQPHRAFASSVRFPLRHPSLPFTGKGKVNADWTDSGDLDGYQQDGGGLAEVANEDVTRSGEEANGVRGS